VESAAALAHTGQVVRVKTKGQTFFLECDAGDTPTQLITRLSKLGHVSPQPYDLHFGAPPAPRPRSPSGPATLRRLAAAVPVRATAARSTICLRILRARCVPAADKVPKKKQGGYLARLQRGPIPLVRAYTPRPVAGRLPHDRLS
jgi:hypothetical protein